MRTTTLQTAATMVIAALAIQAAEAADWRQFRGTDLTGSAAEATLPESLDGALAWKTPLPGRSVASPIVVDGNVIATSSSGRLQSRLHVHCLDPASGAVRWQRQFWATGRSLCHETGAVAAPSPASDGQRIFAFYSSNDLICLDLAGNVLWMRGLTLEHPTAANDIGMAASPVVAGDTVVVQVESQGDSFAMGLDTATGQTRWKIPRKPQSNWTSPGLMSLPASDRGTSPGEVVLLQSGEKLTAHDPRTGKQLWALEEPCGSIPSPVSRGNVAYVAAAGLTALRAEPDSEQTEVLWREAKLAAGSASPALHRNKLFVINRAGVLSAADAASGAVEWQLRLKGTFWATPVAAGDRLYCVNQEGVVQVVKLDGEKGELASQHELGAETLGTPAIADGALYLRSVGHLWKFAAP